MTRSVLHLAVWLIASWCVMTVTHELGHVICGWFCGGRLTSLELRPWHLPHSFFQANPCPLATLWGGPLLGILVPIVFALSVRSAPAWLIAHFCVLANGAYLAAGWASGDRLLDTAQLLQYGAHPAAIATYCAVTIPVGYVGFRRACIHILSANVPSTSGAPPDRSLG